MTFFGHNEHTSANSLKFTLIPYPLSPIQIAMKKLIAILNHNKSQEQGFSMVVSTGFGLFIMMIGLTMMGKAMKDSSISTSQKTITRSDAAAQTGTTRLLALIQKYPQLAGVKDCNRPRSATDNFCSDSINEISWQNPATIPQLNEIAYDHDSDLLNQIRSKTWQDIDPQDPTKGQFKLASYNPPAPGQSGLGTIKIEGRISQSADGKNALQTGSAKLVAELAYTPAQPAQPATIRATVFPGIWLRVAPVTTNQYFLATGLLEDSDTSSNHLYVDPDPTNAPTNTTVAPKTSLRMVSFLSTKPNNFTTGANGQTVAEKPTTTVQGQTSVTLPAPDDLPTTTTIDGVVTDVYKYYAQGITKNWVVNTVNSGGSGNNHAQKVIVYFDGDLDLSSDDQVTHKCTNRQDPTSTLPTGSCDLNNFQIYGYKTSTNPTPKICLNGNKRIEAFVIAPDHTAGMTNSNDDTGGIHGALWAKSWGDGGADCNSNSNHLAVQQKNSDWTEFTAYLPQPEMVVAATQIIPATVGRKLTTVSPNMIAVATESDSIQGNK
jgi:hypothetical protein